MEVSQIISLSTVVEVMINPIINDKGQIGMKADIYPNGTINYFMFGLALSEVPQPLNPAVQNVLDTFKAVVVQKAKDAGYVV